jgi:hypothetical protein
VRRDHQLFASVIQLSLAGTIIAVIAEIAPRFVMVFFQLPAEYAALVFVPAGAGLVLGSIVLPHMIKRLRHSSLLVASGVILLVGCTLALTFLHAVARYVRPEGWSQSVLYYIGVLALTFAMGFGLDLINIPAQTTMQERSPDWIKGRVLALQNMLFNAVTVPIVFGIGLVADYLQLPPAMNVLAVVVLVAGLLTIWYGRQRRPRPLVIQRAPSAPEVTPGVVAFAATTVDPPVPATLELTTEASTNGHHVQPTGQRGAEGASHSRRTAQWTPDTPATGPYQLALPPDESEQPSDETARSHG